MVMDRVRPPQLAVQVGSQRSPLLRRQRTARLQNVNLVRRLADSGVAIVLISHNLADVFEVADDIAVLYLGQMVAQISAADTTRDDVVGYITGTKTQTGAPLIETATIETGGAA